MRIGIENIMTIFFNTFCVAFVKHKIIIENSAPNLF